MSTPHDGMTLLLSDTFTYSGSPPVDPAKWFIGDPRPGNAGFSDAKFLLVGDAHIGTVLTGGGGSPLSINAAYNASGFTIPGGTSNWISALISTAWDVSGSIAGIGVRKGYFEVVMTMPFDPNAQGRSSGTNNGSGTWGAAWLMQFATILGNGPTMEIDTELYGVGDNQFPATSQGWPLASTGPTDAIGNTSHSAWTKQVGNTTGLPTIADFQGVSTTFGMLIDDFNVSWFVDGVLQCVMPLTYPESTDKFFLMIDLGMGGGWPIVPPTPPATAYSLLVSSVKIWEAPTTTITGVTTATITPVSSSAFDITYSTGGAPPPPNPTFSPATSPSTTGSAVTIGTVAPGTSGDTLTVSLTSDPTFSSGSSLVISGSNLVYTPGTITSGNAGTDTIGFTLNESNGASASFTKAITMTFSGGGSGAGNGLVVKNFTRSTDLSHFAPALAAVKAGTAGARCIVACLGDSTTAGVTSGGNINSPVPYPDQLAIALGTVESVPHNYASFYGDQTSFQFTTFTGTGGWNFGLGGPGSGSFNFNAVNDTAIWADTSRLVGTFDRIDVTYYDAGHAGTIDVIIGSNTYPMTIAGTSNTIVTQTLTITSVTDPTAITFKLAASVDGYGFVCGCALWSHATPSIEVRNGGVGGSTMNLLSPATLSGAAAVVGAMSLNPHLVIIDFGINDVNFSGNSGAETLAQMETFLTAAIATIKAPGGSYTAADVLIMCPQPFVATTSPTPTFTQANVVAGQLSVATTGGVPIADLDATYGGSGTAFQACSLSTGSVHPSASGYTDIALRIASFLTNMSQTYASVGLAAPITGSGWVID